MIEDGKTSPTLTLFFFFFSHGISHFSFSPFNIPFFPSHGFCFRSEIHIHSIFRRRTFQQTWNRYLISLENIFLFPSNLYINSKKVTVKHNNFPPFNFPKKGDGETLIRGPLKRRRSRRLSGREGTFRRHLFSEN